MALAAAALAVSAAYWAVSDAYCEAAPAVSDAVCAAEPAAPFAGESLLFMYLKQFLHLNDRIKRLLHNIK